jgi:hypothetical protein
MSQDIAITWDKCSVCNHIHIGTQFNWNEKGNRPSLQARCCNRCRINFEGLRNVLNEGVCKACGIAMSDHDANEFVGCCVYTAMRGGIKVYRDEEGRLIDVIFSTEEG